MISLGDQEKLLLSIAKRLKKKITAYAIGGTAMMFFGFKDSTKDIDLVFNNEKERHCFEEAILSLGYERMNPLGIYTNKTNPPKMFTRGDERFDLFVVEVIDFIFSEEVQKRAENFQQFGDNLILQIANPHDIILMKCATDRIKDKDDVKKIIDAVTIDWKVILKETENQVSLGRGRAAVDLGYFLEEMEELGVKTPKEILDKLWELVEKQVGEKHKRVHS